MNINDNKFYFSSKYGVFIHQWFAVEQNEDNPIYQLQLEYQNNLWEFEDIEDEYIDESVKSMVEAPQELTPRQIRLALIQSGISLNDIDTMIDTVQEPNKSIVRTLREYSLSYNRNDPMLIQFATQLWMNEEQIDNLFILWSTL